MRGTDAALPVQVLLVGKRLLHFTGHHARPVRLLYLLGGDGVGAGGVCAPGAVPGAAPEHLAWPAAAGICAVGILAIFINYAADAQRQRVRATNGATSVWGRPPELIRADYVTADGKQHEALLLASGCGGWRGHFHYMPEILLALAWSLPAGFSHFLPYFYVVYLTVLLIDRAGRDDRRCRKKYGVAWEEYCRRVPWKIIPGVY